MNKRGTNWEEYPLWGTREDLKGRGSAQGREWVKRDYRHLGRHSGTLAGDKKKLRGKI